MACELKQEGFKLKDILLIVEIPEATYHYHGKQFGKMDSDERLKEQVKRLFFEFKERYGYKRLTTELKKEVTVSIIKKSNVS